VVSTAYDLYEEIAGGFLMSALVFLRRARPEFWRSLRLLADFVLSCSEFTAML
jgi:hypothetical protein